VRKEHSNEARSSENGEKWVKTGKRHERKDREKTKQPERERKNGGRFRDGTTPECVINGLEHELYVLLRSAFSSFLSDRVASDGPQFRMDIKESTEQRR
jgi:hypothetical protein